MLNTQPNPNYFTPGFTRTPLKKTGWWASDTAHLYFDNCRVPAANLIGEENQG